MGWRKTLSAEDTRPGISSTGAWETVEEAGPARSWMWHEPSITFVCLRHNTSLMRSEWCRLDIPPEDTWPSGWRLAPAYTRIASWQAQVCPYKKASRQCRCHWPVPSASRECLTWKRHGGCTLAT